MKKWHSINIYISLSIQLSAKLMHAHAKTGIKKTDIQQQKYNNYT